MLDRIDESVLAPYLTIGIFDERSDIHVAIAVRVFAQEFPERQLIAPDSSFAMSDWLTQVREASSFWVMPSVARRFFISSSGGSMLYLVKRSIYSFRNIIDRQLLNTV